MIKRNRLLRKCMTIMLSLALVFTMMPMMPGVTAKANGEEALSKEISSIEATSDVGELLGYKNVYKLPSFTVETGSPAYFDEEGTSAKWQKRNDRGEFVDYKNSYFTEGLYCYTCEVRIPEEAIEAGFRWALPFTIQVDGKTWTADNPDSNAPIKVYSQLYSVEKPDAELTFNHSDAYDVKEAYVGEPITSFSVAESVSGGTAPYTFSKVSGPAWITVSPHGNISGTPTAKGENENLIVRVRDSANAYRDIEIYVENTTEDDGRTIVSKVVASSNIDEMLGYGKPYTRGDTTFSTTSGLPAYLLSNGSNGDWERLVDGEWVQYRNSAFVEGTYRFETQVRIDGDAGATHKLSEKISVTVDGKVWATGNFYCYSNYSLVSVTSPEYIIEKPEQAPLVFSDHENLDIKTPYVGREITSYTLINQVSGGTAPYSFSKVSGPDWITVTEDGTVSGTPDAIGTNEKLIIKVTDALDAYKEITIDVDATLMNPADREVADTFVATSTFKAPAYGDAVTTVYNFNFTSEVNARVPDSMGGWYKKVDGEWVEYTASSFGIGEYFYTNQLRLDSDSGTGSTHQLPKDENISITINGETWTYDSEAWVDDTYSYVYMDSPVYVVRRELPGNITLSQESYTYDGTAKAPEVTVGDLVKDTDYTVSYTDNINAGTATVTITGIGDYSGTIIKTFTINKAALEGVKVTGKTATYNGSAHTVTVSVPSGAKVTYKTSSDGTYSATKPTRTSAGTTTVYYKVTKENYNDVTGSVKIVVNKRSISSAALSYTKTTYSGSAKKPTVTVKNSSGTKLTKDTHYTVTYASGRTKVGRYKVTITGKGNYTGTITKYFTIVPKAPSYASAKLYGHDDVKFSWSKSTGASGYTVYYKKSTSSSYTYLTRTTGTSVKKAGLSDGVKYTFKVVPYYKSGSTRYASTAYKTASIYTLMEMAKPTAAKSGTKVKISWKKINGATGYQVAQYKKQNGKYVKVDSYYTTGSYKLFTAAKGATRYYQVRAYKTVDGKKIFGPWSAKREYKRK